MSRPRSISIFIHRLIIHRHTVSGAVPIITPMYGMRGHGTRGSAVHGGIRLTLRGIHRGHIHGRGDIVPGMDPHGHGAGVAIIRHIGAGIPRLPVIRARRGHIGHIARQIQGMQPVAIDPVAIAATILHIGRQAATATATIPAIIRETIQAAIAASVLRLQQQCREIISGARRTVLTAAMSVVPQTAMPAVMAIVRQPAA